MSKLSVSTISEALASIDDHGQCDIMVVNHVRHALGMQELRTFDEKLDANYIIVDDCGPFFEEAAPISRKTISKLSYCIHPTCSNVTQHNSGYCSKECKEDNRRRLNAT